MVEDALCLRIATRIKSKQPLNLDAQAMLNLTEGMSVLSISRKPLNDLIKRVLIYQNDNNDNLINLNPRLLLQTVALLNDYEVQISEKLKQILNVAIVESNINEKRFSLDDLSYLALVSKDILSEDNQAVLKNSIQNMLPEVE